MRELESIQLLEEDLNKYLGMMIPNQAGANLQFVNIVREHVERTTTDNREYAKCTRELIDLNNDGAEWSKKGIMEVLKKHFA